MDELRTTIIGVCSFVVIGFIAFLIIMFCLSIIRFSDDHRCKVIYGNGFYKVHKVDSEGEKDLCTNKEGVQRTF